MKSFLAVALVTIVISAGDVSAGIKMPFAPGQTMECSQGNNAPQCCDYDHWSSLGMAWAWDFNLSGTSDLGMPVVSPMDGKVVELDNDCGGCTSGWGNYVIVKLSDGTYARLTHLTSVVVGLQDSVKAGQVLGMLGSTGHSTGPHLHFQLQGSQSGSSIQTSFDDVGVPVEGGGPYTSLNRNIFDLRESEPQNGQYVLNAFGATDGGVHWHQGWSSQYRYFADGTAKRCYIQDYAGNGGTDGAIVYDALGGARKAYIIGWNEWNHWSSEQNPEEVYGLPITNSYWTGSEWRQDFQKKYIVYGGNPNSYPLCAPGWTSSGWNNEYSYLFAMAYERNGGAPNVGLPSSAIYSYGPYLRQDFTGGSFGNCCILYDPANADGNPYATNEAYLLRTGFYDYYQANGGSGLGCPTRDEYATGDPGDAIQFFFRRPPSGPDEWHHMYFDAYDPGPPEKWNEVEWSSTYEMEYVSQTPAGQFTMEQGESRTFTVQFRNNGTTTWRNNPSAYPVDYVELKSCDANGATCESFLNYPYSGSLGWLNNTSPCTMQETSVAPGEVATFTFTGKVDENASPGLHKVYFRVNHSVGGLMQDWGGMHFQVNVVEPPPSSDTYDDLAILYDYGSCLTKAHTFLSTGSAFANFAIWREQSDFCLSAVKFAAKGDFNGDGEDDIAMLYDYGSCTVAIHNFMSNGTGFGYQSYWWDAGGYCAYAMKGMVAGYFNNDQFEDLAIVYDYGNCETRIHMLLSNGSTFTSQGMQGWWSAPGWYCASAIHSVLSGDFNGDGMDDVMMGYRYGPSESAFHAFLSTGTSFTYQSNWWHVDYFSFDAVPHVASGDFNGDGFDDIVAAYRYGDNSTAFHTLISSGQWLNYSTYWFWADGWYSLNSVKHLEAGDFNGDGKDDVATAYDYGSCTAKIHRFTSIGSSFTYEGVKWESSGYCLYAAKYMLAGKYNFVTGSPKVASEGPEQLVPSVFSLNQNYPNPFNPVTTISYSLPEASDVKLDVFNILGQHVATLVDEHQSAGEHTVLWNSNGHSSGIYLYRLSTPEAVETRKMLLLK